ncbi:site-specific integrase [Noviherbaspirillum galbum]|uniref:Uncharacterized protein n=1 Tax=Noviherbaspirillum galbum TaxID=2709383 RepID=A0A6B3SRH8_9BURK|nr:hypothetical protein [Noviherbaspirillum galbum]NEX63353.1 hypothetical protein [Noviherbaspirillum galbum]
MSCYFPKTKGDRVYQGSTFKVPALRKLCPVDAYLDWASTNGWDLKTLMQYVGWKDVKSAMRYVDAADPFARSGLKALPAAE